MHNCVNGSAAAQLLAAWQRFQDDDSLLVAVLHGAGDKSFCSGADLTALDQLATLGEETASRGELEQQGTGPMGGTRLVQVKPVITMAQGYAYAGGLELFCHGHIRIAEPQATFSVACRALGVPLVDGGTVYLPRLLGWGNALPLIITGERISAQRAPRNRPGLGSRARRDRPGPALDIAEQICQQPRNAMLADLGSAINGLYLSMEDALDVEAANMYRVMRSESPPAAWPALPAASDFGLNSDIQMAFTTQSFLNANIENHATICLIPTRTVVEGPESPPAMPAIVFDGIEYECRNIEFVEPASADPGQRNIDPDAFRVCLVMLEDKLCPGRVFELREGCRVVAGGATAVTL